MTTAYATADLVKPETTAVAMDGSLQFWAGLSYGSASLVQYLVLSGRLHLPHPAMIGLIWMVASIAFVLFGVILRVGSDHLLRKDPAVRRFRAVWGSLILGAAVVIIALIIMLVKLGLGGSSNTIVSPIAMAAYGIGWRVAAVLSAKRWPNILSVGCFASAIALASLAGTAEQPLVYALSLVIFAILPGLYLMRRTAN